MRERVALRLSFKLSSVTHNRVTGYLNAPMVKIEVFLSVEDKQLSFLSIPRSDIERLAIFPFRWLRFVVFSICGACGELSTTPNGPPVDYEKPQLTAENKYYYRHLGKLSLCV